MKFHLKGSRNPLLLLIPFTVASVLLIASINMPATSQFDLNIQMLLAEASLFIIFIYLLTLVHELIHAQKIRKWAKKLNYSKPVNIKIQLYFTFSVVGYTYSPFLEYLPTVINNANTDSLKRNLAKEALKDISISPIKYTHIFTTAIAFIHFFAAILIANMIPNWYTFQIVFNPFILTSIMQLDPFLTDLAIYYSPENYLPTYRITSVLKCPEKIN